MENITKGLIKLNGGKFRMKRKNHAKILILSLVALNVFGSTIVSAEKSNSVQNSKKTDEKKEKNDKKNLKSNSSEKKKKTELKGNNSKKEQENENLIAKRRKKVKLICEKIDKIYNDLKDKIDTYYEVFYKILDKVDSKDIKNLMLKFDNIKKKINEAYYGPADCDLIDLDENEIKIKLDELEDEASGCLDELTKQGELLMDEGF